MKVQFGSALADHAQTNAFVKIPGLRGLPAREISVKNLASIIQARMSEILAFVTFHLKQVGLDNKMLNGGIVLTGGGSQLKHLIQLTEYATGLNARLGYPNEHLASNHISELEKPMYATCIGLILKGYNIYESNHKRLYPDEQRILVKPLQKETPDPVVNIGEPEKQDVVKKGKTLKDLMDSMKHGLIDLFKEEVDTKFKQ